MPRVNGDGLQVLVVDDSAMVRQVMQAILGTDRRINVKAAADPLIAWVKMQKEPPDVVITDLEMPRMDGLTFIKKIMLEMPTPVVVCSGLAARGTELALRRANAVEKALVDQGARADAITASAAGKDDEPRSSVAVITLVP